MRPLKGRARVTKLGSGSGSKDMGEGPTDVRTNPTSRTAKRLRNDDRNI
jgi:hypothetical protein